MGGWDDGMMGLCLTPRPRLAVNPSLLADRFWYRQPGYLARIGHVRRRSRLLRRAKLEHTVARPADASKQENDCVRRRFVRHSLDKGQITSPYTDEHSCTPRIQHS